MPACVHIGATHFGFVLKKEKKLPLYTLRGEGQVLCGKVLKGAAQGYLVIIRGKFLIVYHMLVKFYHQDIHLLKQFAGAELMCIFDVGNIFIFIQPYFFLIFFFYERLQLHKIKRLRSLFHIYSYISNIVMYFYKSSDLGAQTPPILVIDVFRKGSLQQACKVTRLQ